MVTIADQPVDQPEQPVARAASWQVQTARAQLSTLIDEALAVRPQRITRRGRDVAVILAATEYDRLTKPQESLVDFWRNSPLAEAMAEGRLDLERDPIRDLGW